MRDKTIDVTAETFKSWVEGTIAEWLPGYIDVDEETTTQYKITHIGEDLYLVKEGGQVSTGRAPRGFRVVVHVVEQP